MQRVIQYSRIIIIPLATIFSMVGCGATKNWVDASKSHRYYYSANKTKIFYNCTGPMHLIPRSLRVPTDVDSFKVFNGIYSKDKKHIYLAGQRMTNIDYDSFRFLKYNKYADKDHVYSLKTKRSMKGITCVINSTLKIIEDADPETFEVFSNHKPNTRKYWAKDKNNFYYDNKIADVDYDSFKILSDSMSIDKNYIYMTYYTPMIKYANQDKSSDNITRFGNDMFYSPTRFYQQIITRGSLIILPVKNANTIKTIKTNHYVSIDGKVYYDGELIQGADSATFDVLENYLTLDDYPLSAGHSKDNVSVYYMGKIMPLADAQTFTVVKKPTRVSYITKDKNNVYFYDKKIPNLSPHDPYFSEKADEYMDQWIDSQRRKNRH